jgi:hypothetical protein
MRKKQVIKIILLVLVTRLGLLYLRQLRGISWETDIDGYAEYAQALFSGHLLDSSIRSYIFPGFPLIIGLLHYIIPNWTLASLLIVVLGDIVGYLAIASLFSYPLAVFLLFLPPALLFATSRIYSEGPTLAILFGSLWLWIHDRKTTSWILAGFGCLIRTISLTLMVTYLVLELKERNYKKLFYGLLFGLIPILGLLIYNTYFWGNPLHNLEVYRVGGNALVPIYTLFDDIARLIRDHGYRTLVSGLFYLVFTTMGLLLLWIKRKINRLFQICFMWAIFQYAFLLTIGPAPIMENYGRYAVFLYPLVFFAFKQFLPFSP